MNWKLLGTMVTLIGVGASVALGQGTTPTIVQGDYISNVFGNSNFIKNPNAKLNNANVTVSNATVTRSTTTPLVATTEFNVTTSTATGYVDWDTRTFDAGMKNQNCEARFTYRGFSVGSTTAQIIQGASTVVAQLTLTASTDPRIASINFPCGDLSSATTFRLQQATASLTGTNEIGGIYVGLATNMANVAQAEVVVKAFVNTTQSIPNNTETTVGYNSETLDTYGEFNTSTYIFTAKRAGEYSFSGAFMFDSNGWTINQTVTVGVAKNGTSATSVAWYPVQNTISNYFGVQYAQTLTLAVGDTARIVVLQNRGAATNIFASALYSNLVISRFPSSSELVVTPERQNWYISAYHGGANPLLSAAAVASRTEITNGSLSLTPTVGSQPAATLCSGTNAPPALSTSATTCAAGNESVGLTFNIPSTGIYEVCAAFGTNVEANAASSADTVFSIEETSTTSATNLTTNPSIPRYSSSSTAQTATTYPTTKCQLFNFSSLGQKAVRLMYMQNVTGTVTQNLVIADAVQGRIVQWTVTPVTNQSNSALYVEGPVRGANTNTAIPTNSIGGKVIDASLARTTTSLGTWQVASGNFGTPPAGSYLMMMNSVGTSTAGLTGSGSIINENGSSVTPVVCQLNSINSSANDSVYGRVCYYTTDGTKTLYAWAQATGANTTVTTNLILVRLN